MYPAVPDSFETDLSFAVDEEALGNLLPEQQVHLTSSSELFASNSSRLETA